MIKSFLVILLLLTTIVCNGQLYFEDFSAEGNGATTGTAAGTIGGTWSVTTTPSGGAGSFSKQSTGLNERFTINQTGSEGVWKTNSINISTQGTVGIDISLVTYYASASDYVRAYYVLDGGPEVLFGELYGGSYSIDANASVVLSGNTLQIVVRGRENTGGSTLLVSNMMRFDDVTITKITTLYSRTASANWNNTTSWSTVSHVGASCGCTPDNTNSVQIGNGHTVSVNALGDVVNVKVNSGGTLHFAATNELNVARGGSITIDNGGSITTNGASNQINFDYQAANNIIVNGNLSIGDFEVNAKAVLNFSGTGSVTMTDDFIFSTNATDAAVNNSITGSLFITDVLQLNAGSVTITNNGQMTISNDLIFNSDLNTINNSGTLTIGSELLANDNADDQNTVNNNVDGTLVVGNIRPNDGNMVINNHATIRQSGNFINVDAGSSFNNLNNSVWEWSYVPGTIHDVTTATIFDGSSFPNTFTYNGAGVQDIMNTTYYHLNIAGSGTKSTTANLNVDGNLTITSTLNVDDGNDNINLAGNWSNSGNFSEGAGGETVILDGAMNQTISSTASGETFNRLNVNKSSGAVVLSHPVIVSNTTGTGLNLIQGVVNTSLSAMLTLNDNVSSNGGDADSYIDGPMAKIGDDAFVFPTGDATVFARIGISAPTSNTTFRAQYFDGSYATVANDGTMDNISAKEYWLLDRIVGSANVTVSLFWESNTRSEIDDISTGDLVVARFNGTKWESAGRSAISGPIAKGNVTSIAVSNFSPFTFGSLAFPTNPLPITLDYFTATMLSKTVALQWRTLSEINNKTFTVERSTNAEEFVAIATLDGHGTTNQPHLYKTIDAEPHVGKAYYRLKQTDYDGTATYSEVRHVQYDAEITLHPVLNIFPNPVQNNVLSFELEGVAAGTELDILVIDSRGKVVLQRVLRPDMNEIRHEVTLPAGLPSGLYFLRTGRQSQLIRKFLID
jgi:hypothetical protein